MAAVAPSPSQLPTLAGFSAWSCAALPTAVRGPACCAPTALSSLTGARGSADLVGPSLVGPVSRDFAGAFERAAASPGMAAALIESVVRAGVNDLLAAVRMPALVVHREHDMIPLGDARVVADAIPGAVLQVVPRPGPPALGRRLGAGRS